MNERIKELIEHANLSADKTYQFDPKDGFQIQEWDKIRIEKFAKLIVRECADIANSHFERKVAGYPGDKIEEHFGVE